MRPQFLDVLGSDDGGERGLSHFTSSMGTVI